MQTSMRIVSGQLRGRKLTCNVEPKLRPMPDRVRESLFSILTSEIAGRPFFDLFAGTGAVGMEGLSRGAAPSRSSSSTAKPRPRSIVICGNLASPMTATVLKADVYRWASRWLPPNEPVTIFLGPPFPDSTIASRN